MKKTLSVVLALVMIAAAVAAAIPAGAAKVLFSDVTEDMWSYNSILYAVKEGYMNGVGGDRFDPEGPLTRAMVATVLWRREGSPAPTAPSGFEDVPAGEWYTDAVAWAKETGVVKGLTMTTFGPDEYITREQLATMLFRFSSNAPVSVPERADLGPFSDDERVSDWAEEPLGWAVESDLIKGTDGNRLAPDGFATREQFAAIMERYDASFKLAYTDPVIRTHFTEPEYPLVKNADVYVSTTGSDDNDGTFEHPLATWNKAVEAVRELKKTKTDDITVAFMAGEYGPLSLKLTAEDSGDETQRITYCKYGDGDVVFDNGTNVREDEFEPLSDAEKELFSAKAADKIRKADVTGKLGDFDITDLVLSENGEMTVARYPNKYYDGTDALLQGGHTVDESHIRVYNQVLRNRILKYKSREGLYLYGYITLGWYKDYIETDESYIDPETGDPVFHVSNLDRTRGSNLRLEEGFETDFYQMAIINIPEELDGEGEFILSRDKNTLYVYDPKGDYVFLNEGDMITMDHADNISFVGLTLKNTLSMIIAAEHSHGITIDGCRISGSGAHEAVSFRHCDEGRRYDITVKNCEFSFTAATALEVNIGYDLDQVRDTNLLFTSSDGVLIDNNLFTRTSLTMGNCGAVAVHVFGPTVSHNEFIRCYWEGIDFRGSVNMTAEYNVFNGVCWNGDDTGMINNWYSIDRCGNVVRYNLFMSTLGGSVNGCFALYLDDTTGTSVYSNIFYDVSVTAMNNGVCKYNTFCDNIIINPWSSEGIGCDYRTGGTEGVAARMEEYGDPSSLLTYGGRNRWVNVFALFDEHPEYKEKAGERWDGFFKITTDVEKWNTPEYCVNNSLVITGNREINENGTESEYNELIRRYSVIEDNVYYASTENPLFINPSRGDYRLKDGADVPDVHFEEMGRY